MKAVGSGRQRALQRKHAHIVNDADGYSFETKLMWRREPVSELLFESNFSINLVVLGSRKLRTDVGWLCYV
eukprot:4824388-Amphidinium_carterae.1